MKEPKASPPPVTPEGKLAEAVGALATAIVNLGPVEPADLPEVKVSLGKVAAETGITPSQWFAVVNAVSLHLGQSLAEANVLEERRKIAERDADYRRKRGLPDPKPETK